VQSRADPQSVEFVSSLKNIVSWNVAPFVDPVRTDFSEERIASIIRVTRIGVLGTTLAVTSNRSTLQRYYYFFAAFHPDDGGDAFLRKVCSYKRPTAEHLKTVFFTVRAVKTSDFTFPLV
jgi:hypothetical protein